MKKAVLIALGFLVSCGDSDSGDMFSEDGESSPTPETKPAFFPENGVYELEFFSLKETLSRGQESIDRNLSGGFSIGCEVTVSKKEIEYSGECFSEIASEDTRLVFSFESWVKTYTQDEKGSFIGRVVSGSRTEFQEKISTNEKMESENNSPLSQYNYFEKSENGFFMKALTYDIFSNGIDSTLEAKYHFKAVSPSS